MIDYDEENQLYFPTKINDPQFFSAFGTKAFKATDDLKVVEEFCKNKGLTAKLLYRPNQVHSTKIKVLSSDSEKEIEDADGVITDQKDVALVIRTADCVPIVFADKKTGFIGISHQGWRGTLDGMVKNMVAEFINLESNISDIQVAIGPSINLCCFEVKDDVFSEVKKKEPRHFSAVSKITEGKIYINLLQLNYLQLLDTGLPKDQIEFFPFCTMCNEEQFFSYRRDYKAHYDSFGQQVSFIIKQ